MEKTEQFYQQVTESIKLVFDLTSRIDERVKILVEQQSEAHDRIDRLVDKQEAVVSRLAVLENKNGSAIKEELIELKKAVRELEIKVAAVEFQSGAHENKWKVVSDFVFKIILAAIGAFLAWKLSSH